MSDTSGPGCDIEPECGNCGQPMVPDVALGDDCWACDDCDMGAQVNRRVLGRPVVVEFFGIEHGSANA